MPITDEIVDAFLKCETKAYLRLRATSSGLADFARWEPNLRERYRAECCEFLRSGCAQWYSGTPHLQSLKLRRHPLIFDYVVDFAEIHARLDALVLNRARSSRFDCPYIPVRFVPSEKLSTNDKLLLAFDALAFSKAYGKMPRAGRIIHGRNHTLTNVTMSALLGKIQCVLKAIYDQQTNADPPVVALNKHCAECEFKTRCRQAALQKDDLSLLTTISAKERKKQNDKGIFTVRQLSHTFRSPKGLQRVRGQSISLRSKLSQSEKSKSTF